MMPGVRMQGLGASPLLSWHFACFQADLGDHSACILSKSVQKQAPSPPFPLQVSSMSGEYLSTDLISV